MRTDKGMDHTAGWRGSFARACRFRERGEVDGEQVVAGKGYGSKNRAGLTEPDCDVCVCVVVLGRCRMWHRSVVGIQGR